MIDVLLISTTDHRGAAHGILERMLASVAAAARALPEARITHLLLLQNCSQEELAQRAADFPDFVRPTAIAKQISLSAARNRLMRPLIETGQIPAHAIVGFPDDDCWYPAGTLEAIVKHFVGDPRLDFWFCRYASQPDVAGLRPELGGMARASEVVRNASSNTIFVRGRIASAIGGFDENLGVGTPNLGGEDLDFALSAYALAENSWFQNAAAVGHRDAQPALRAKYYPGSLLVLGRHAGTSLPLAKEYVRKIGVGIYLLLRRELPLTAFSSANLKAFQEAVRGSRRSGASPSVHAPLR